jgi:hypothetical protein
MESVNSLTMSPALLIWWERSTILPSRTWMRALLRIPSHGDQHSELMSITIPK